MRSHRCRLLAPFARLASRRRSTRGCSAGAPGACPDLRSRSSRSSRCRDGAHTGRRGWRSGDGRPGAGAPHRRADELHEADVDRGRDTDSHETNAEGRRSSPAGAVKHHPRALTGEATRRASTPPRQGGGRESPRKIVSRSNRGTEEAASAVPESRPPGRPRRSRSHSQVQCRSTMYVHTLFLSVLVVVIAYVMVLAGVKKRALEWRHRGRVCPSCGRDAARGCRCRRS